MDKDAAIKTLESYLDEHTSVTQKNKLIAVLKEQGFPYPIAVTAVDEVMKERDTTIETTTAEYDPIKAALNACTNRTAGPSNGIESLENDGYTHEEAESIVAGFDLDWNELAVQCATIKMNFYGIHWLDKGGLDDLIYELKHMGYTQEQATYGAQTWWNNYQSQNS